MSKAQINTFYQQLKHSEQPKYDFETLDDGFICTLTLPAFERESQTFYAAEFKGQARTKKLASAQAADFGWAALKEHPALNVTTEESVWQVIHKLQEQGFAKDPEFEGYVLLAQETGQNLPVHLLQLARPIQAWARKQLPEATSAEIFMLAFRDALQKTPMCAQLADSFELEGNTLRLKQQFRGKRKSGDQKALRGFLESNEGSSRPYTAIIVPANSSNRIREVAIEGSENYLESIARLVGGVAEDVVVWGRIGKAKSVYLPKAKLPGFQPQQSKRRKSGRVKRMKTSHHAQDGSQQLPDPNKDSCPEESPATASIDEFLPDAEAVPQNSSSCEDLTTWEGRPAGYSVYDPAAYNIRGSVLLGKPVHGDLVLSNCRLRANEERCPVMVWGNFNLDMFWGWCGALFPSSEFAASSNMPLIATMPSVFGTLKGWTGTPPCQFVEQFLTSLEYCTQERSPQRSEQRLEQSASMELSLTPDARISQPKMEEQSQCRDIDLKSQLHPVSDEPERRDTSNGIASNDSGLSKQNLSCLLAPGEIDPVKSLNGLADQSMLRQQGCGNGCAGDGATDQPMLDAAGSLDESAAHGPEEADQNGAISESQTQGLQTGLPSKSSGSDAVLKTEGETSWRCEVSGTILGLEQLSGTGNELLSKAAHIPRLSARVEGCHSEESSRQQAALILLRRCELLRTQIFANDFAAHCGAKSLAGSIYRESATQASERLNLQLQPSQTLSGCLIKFSFRILSSNGTLMSEGSSRIQLGTGVVLPKIDQALTKLKPSKMSSQSMLLNLNGQNQFAVQQQMCTVALTASQSGPQAAPRPRPAAEGGGQRALQQTSLFEPSMSKQRLQHISDTLESLGATDVLDIGCGAVKLVEHLLNQTLLGRSGVRKIVGIDIDGQAVERGLRKILRQPELVAERQPIVELYDGNIACSEAALPGAWGVYTGVQAAVFQEVIEHLDPEPLGHLAGSLLGSLQPKALILSTPNFEYNKVLHNLEQGLLGNGLRNIDHRFEWTRKEFEEWCTEAAASHNYDVQFEGLGHAKEEAKALSALNISDAGASTQVAVFRRKTMLREIDRPEGQSSKVFKNKLFSSSDHQIRLRQEALTDT